MNSCRMLNDGHQEAARLLMKREGMKKVLMPLNKDYLKNTTMNEYDEDQMILKHCEEIRSEVFKKFEGWR